MFQLILGAPDGNAIPISQEDALYAFDAAACIGCGACVAACKNASASLFVSAKVSQLASYHRAPERDKELFQWLIKWMKRVWALYKHRSMRSRVPERNISRIYKKMNWEYHRANIKG